MSTDGIGHETRFKLTKFRPQSDEDSIVNTIEDEGYDVAIAKHEPYEVYEWKGNIGLQEGLQEMWDLVIGAGGTPFNNTNTYVGVGDSDTGAVSTQVGLSGTSKFYKKVSAGYPSRSGQTVTFLSVFASDEANFHWKEFTVANGSSDSAKNLFRKVHVRDTKLAGEEWTLEVKVTLE